MLYINTGCIWHYHDYKIKWGSIKRLMRTESHSERSWAALSFRDSISFPWFSCTSWEEWRTESRCETRVSDFYITRKKKYREIFLVVRAAPLYRCEFLLALDSNWVSFELRFLYTRAKRRFHPRRAATAHGNNIAIINFRVLLQRVLQITQIIERLGAKLYPAHAVHYLCNQNLTGNALNIAKLQFAERCPFWKSRR